MSRRRGRILSGRPNAGHILEYAIRLTEAVGHVIVPRDFQQVERFPDRRETMSPKEQTKLFYRLEEVCRLAKVDAATVETWEKEFPFLEPGLTGAGQKIFRLKDLEIIRRIKELLDHKNFTLAGARRRIEEDMGLRPMPAVHPDKIVKLLWQVRDDLQDLSQSLDPRSKKT
jgi:DNA-binding transcriptional MerR regulator